MLPSGRYLKIKIMNNWGDKRFVGFSGIEIFDDQGINITKFMFISIQIYIKILSKKYKIEIDKLIKYKD